MHPTERDNLLTKWKAAKAALAEIKETEADLRQQLSKEFFPKPDKGTQRVELGFGYNLKLVHKLNYTFTSDMALETALAEIAETNNEGPFIAKRLVNYKPAISVKEYEILDPIYKAIIDKVLVTKEATPVLELESPKNAK